MATTSCSRSTISSATRSSARTGRFPSRSTSADSDSATAAARSAPEGNYLDPDTGAVSPGNRCSPARRSTSTAALAASTSTQSVLTLYNGADRTAGDARRQLQDQQRPEGVRATSRTRMPKITSRRNRFPTIFFVPSGTGVIAGRFMQGGPRITDRKSDLFDINVGLEGTTKWFDWDFAIGHGESHVKNSDRNYYDATKWDDATGNGAPRPDRHDQRSRVRREPEGQPGPRRQVEGRFRGSPRARPDVVRAAGGQHRLGGRDVVVEGIVDRSTRIR